MAVLTELRQQRPDRKVWKAGIELKGFCTMESDEDGGERQCFGKSYSVVVNGSSKERKAGEGQL